MIERKLADLGNALPSFGPEPYVLPEQVLIERGVLLQVLQQLF